MTRMLLMSQVKSQVSTALLQGPYESTLAGESRGTLVGSPGSGYRSNIRPLPRGQKGGRTNYVSRRAFSRTRGERPSGDPNPNCSESRAGDVRGPIELHIGTRVLLPLSFEYAKYSSILSVSVNQSPSDSVRITKRGMKNRPDSTRVFERSDLSNSGYSLALVALTLPGHRVHVLATSFSLRPASMASSSWL